MKCPKCQAPMTEPMYFCHQCGSLSKTIDLKSEELKKIYEDKMKGFIRFVENNSSSSVDVLWDKTIERYVQTINRMQAMLSHEEIQKSTPASLVKGLGNFIEKCKTPEFHIAFVGAIKAGKSTLINALLGKKLASTSVTPETAVLTKFRASKNQNYVKITFYNAHEWNELWKSVQESKSTLFLEEYNKLNADAEKGHWIGQADHFKQFEDIPSLEQEIEKWTSSKKATHYFVKEVEVGLTDFNLPEQVVFVDTPGLDDAVRYRSDVTRRYIDRANAVFACVKSDAMTGQELATLYRVFANTRYNPEKVYVIGTQWDTLNRPEENWKQQKEEWIKYLKQDDCYGNAVLAEKNVIAVAAHIFNLVTHFDQLDEDSMYELMSIGFKFKIRDVEGNLERLKELSNIDYFKHILSTEIIAKYKDFLYQDLQQSYVETKEDIRKFFEEVREKNVKLLDMANGDIHQIQQEREKSQQDLKEIEVQRDNLLKTLNLVRRSTDQRVEELCAQLRKTVVR